MLAVATCNSLVDRLFVKLQTRHGEQSYPEGRLPLVITGAFLLPVTVVLYGWAPQLQWPAWTLLLIVVVSVITFGTINAVHRSTFRLRLTDVA